MTIDAWWEVVRWIGVPAVGGLLWWINDLRRQLSDAKGRLFKGIEECRAEHRDEVKSIRAELSGWQLQVERTYASDQRVREHVERLEEAVDRLADKLDRVLEVLALSGRTKKDPG